MLKNGKSKIFITIRSSFFVNVKLHYDNIIANKCTITELITNRTTSKINISSVI